MIFTTPSYADTVIGRIIMFINPFIFSPVIGENQSGVKNNGLIL